MALSVLSVGFAFIYGFLLRFSIPLIPLLDADSGGYLTPAIDFYDRSELALLFGRSFPYPLFLGLILSLTKSFEIISVIQHSSGLLTGLLLFAIFFRLGRMARKTSWLQSLLVAFGAIGAMLFLLSPAPIFFEHLVRTESINPLLIVAGLHAQISLIQAWIERRTKAFLMWITTVVILNVFAYVFRPNLGFAMLLGPFIGLVLLWRYPLSRSSKTAVLAASALGVLLLCVWPQRHFIQFREDNYRVRFLPIALLACHGQLLVPILEEDLKREDYSIGTRDQLELLRKILITAFDKHQRKEVVQYPLLGINPDTIMYNNVSTYALFDSFKTTEEFASFGYRYFARLLWRDPAGYLTKVRGQLSAVYGRSRGSAFLVEPKVDFTYDTKRTAEIIPGPTMLYRRTPKTEQFLAKYSQTVTEKLAMFEQTSPKDHPFNINPVGDLAQPYLNRWHWWSVMLFPILFAAYILATLFSRPYTRTSVALLALGSAASYMLVYNFLHCLSIAVIGSLDVGRYIQAQYTPFLCYLLLSLCWASGVILQLSSVLVSGSRRLLRLSDSRESVSADAMNELPKRIAHVG